MRISDWSSDVVSSDLFVVAILEPLPGVPQHVVQTKCVGRKRTYWRRVLPAVGVFGQWSVRAPVDTGVRVVMDVLITPIERRGRPGPCRVLPFSLRSEEHTSELQSLMRISYAVFCLKKNNNDYIQLHSDTIL